MTYASKYLLGGVALAALSWHVIVGEGPARAALNAATDAAAAQSIHTNPDRDAYFGDLHLHTTNSFDAYALMGTKTTPDEAYKFARGDTINYLGEPIRRSEPLDFLAVTDHSENIGVFNTLDDPKSPLSLSEVGALVREGGYKNFIKLVAYITEGKPLPGDAKGISASTWEREKQAANANYQPGKFTTFIAYEWTSMPGGQNLHRNVIFKGGIAPAPFTSIDSKDPKDLWTYLARIRAQGYEALAISHNANASNGLMYDWTQADGRPIDEAWAQLRATNEPLTEIAQNKGTSETHPALSANDEFAGYEIMDHLLIGNVASKPGGSYVRDSLGRGLVIAGKIGVNPYKHGFVGAGDLHSGLTVNSAEEYGGVAAANLGGGKLNKAQTEEALGLAQSKGDPLKVGGLPAVVLSPAALTGVWAQSNTREAIYDALRRKETYATSGSHVKLRFFGGWGWTPSLLGQANWVHAAYAQGVPMGSDLPSAKPGAPSLAIQAVKDPNRGNLDRVQVIRQPASCLLWAIRWTSRPANTPTPSARRNWRPSGTTRNSSAIRRRSIMCACSKSQRRAGQPCGRSKMACRCPRMSPQPSSSARGPRRSGTRPPAIADGDAPAPPPERMTCRSGGGLVTRAMGKSMPIRVISGGRNGARVSSQTARVLPRGHVLKRIPYCQLFQLI